MTVVKKEFNVGGMHCGACAAGINMLLGSTDGIKSSSISWEQKSGEIEYDDSKITLEGIQKAVSDLGYTATPK